MIMSGSEYVVLRDDDYPRRENPAERTDAGA